MKRTPFLRNSTLRPSCTRIKPISPEKSGAQAKYRGAKAYQLLKFPRCQMPGCRCSANNSDLVDVHHRARRIGVLLYAVRYFATLCRAHHDYVETHASWARENGWLVDLSSDQMRALRTEELLGADFTKLPETDVMNFQIASRLSAAAANIWFHINDIKPSPTFKEDVALLRAHSLGQLQTASDQVEAENAKMMEGPAPRKIRCTCTPETLVKMKAYADAARV